MKSVATYCYCVVASPRAPRAGRARGLASAGAPRVIPAGRGLWLVVCDAPLERYGSAAIDRGLRDLDWVASCAVAHETVVEGFAGQATIVPMKLFTLFASDERAQAHIHKVRPRIERAVRRVTGCSEWGLRVALDERNALKKVRETIANDTRALASGRAFLVAKKKQADAVRALGGTARADADELYDALAGRARDARKRPPPAGAVGARMLLDAVFLVPRSRAAGFRKAAQAAAARLHKGGYAVTITGPWP